MENGQKVSLIDLSSQFPFEIDDAIKKDLCFGETLIISCCHYEGEVDNEQCETEWSCQDTTSSSASNSSKEILQKENEKNDIFEIRDKLEKEETQPVEDETENDFHFFFFPDCNKPSNSQQSVESIIQVDGLPKINPKANHRDLCQCLKNSKGHCDCFTKLPCKCGANTTDECTCINLETICICDQLGPNPTCMCKSDKVCVCYPGHPQPTCTCDRVDKPCICYEKSGKFPSPICTCKRKANFENHLDLWTGEFKPIQEESEEFAEEMLSVKDDLVEDECTKENDKCTCQVTGRKSECLCLKEYDKKCICVEASCICGVHRSCLCEPSASDPHICRESDCNIPCECPQSKVCSCQDGNNNCKCFERTSCNCEYPENCKCFVTCDCKETCIYADVTDKESECGCSDKNKPVCICKTDNDNKDIRKLKKVRAGKDGYRWCHDVDPRHTFFDYGYDRHDKIVTREVLREKVTILGLHDKKEPEKGCDLPEITPPAYKKTVRKPSVDCCSAVGGISICVETLGEDKDKFLVQVVSHSSKEGAKSGTKLVSIVDCNLHTMEENRTEHISKHNIRKERKSYIAICESGYYNKVTRTCGDRSVVQRHYHSFDDAKNFLLEGANVVLLRYFAVRRYRGNVKTETVMMNGSICESIYVCHGVSQAIVNGKPLFVVKVERHIVEASGFVHQTLTVLSLRGYMISHEWADNNYIFHINPLLNVIPEKDEIECHAPLRERWRDDMQLLSDYLDFKSTRTSEGGRYITENGALTNTIRDYLQALLLLRPQDALQFTRHYFGSALSALDLPHDEYFDPASRHVRYYFFED